MKHIATVALMLNLGAAGVYAQQKPVTMTFSGTGGASTINLQYPNTNNSEDNTAGNGTLGPFTFRDVRAAANSPQPSSACAGVFFPTVAGGGILRFQDGSLLKVNVTAGGDCIDFVKGVGHCTLTLQIAGGTGRFQGASGGVLTYTETALPVLFDALGIPVLFTETGDITGTIDGIAMQGDSQDGRQ